jgi:hypothetical protein
MEQKILSQKYFICFDASLSHEQLAIRTTIGSRRGPQVCAIAIWVVGLFAQASLGDREE